MWRDEDGELHFDNEHEEAVYMTYIGYKQNLENTRWDEVYHEVLYYYHPDFDDEDMVGQKKGEFDIMLVDRDAKVIKYIEIKTRSKDREYAEEQIQRAKKHWGKLGWKVEGDPRVM